MQKNYISVLSKKKAAKVARTAASYPEDQQAAKNSESIAKMQIEFTNAYARKLEQQKRMLKMEEKKFRC